MKSHTYVRDQKGRYTRKTNWKAIVFGLTFLAIGIAYINHAYAAGSTSDMGGGTLQRQNSGSGTRSQEVGKEDLESDCVKLENGTYDCTEDINAEKQWRAFEQSHLPVTFTATVTGYSSRVQETDSSPEIAANGQNINTLNNQGEKTCATNDLPLGTKLYLNGLGTCTVNDRMNSRYSGTGSIDWYFGHDTAQAIKFGVKKVAVTILK